VHRTGWRLAAATAAAVLAIAGAGTWGYRQYDAHRTEKHRTDASLAAQLTAQKLATEQARQAAEEAKREAQKLAGEEGLRRAQEERNRIEQERRQLETERRAAEAAKRLAAEEDLRRAQEERGRLGQERLRLDTEKQAAEAAKRQAAEEALRRAQERSQLDQERARLEVDRQAAEAARRQVEASQRAAAAAVKEAPKIGALYDGTYRGRLCNQVPNKAPVCWPVALVVQGGVVEGSWISKTKKTSTARGTVAADGSVQLNLAAWISGGSPDVALLLGRIADGAIAASGQWRTSSGIVGDWRRVQVVAAEPDAKDAMKFAVSHNGTYTGRLCNQFPDKAPVCWQIALSVLNGIAEGSWIHATKKSAWARGTVGADGSVRLNLESWTTSGNPAGANLAGRVADGTINASGLWGDGRGVDGEWKRMP
jgi:hypothetical protein